MYYFKGSRLSKTGKFLGGKNVVPHVLKIASHRKYLTHRARPFPDSVLYQSFSVIRTDIFFFAQYETELVNSFLNC